MKEKTGYNCNIDCMETTKKLAGAEKFDVQVEVDPTIDSNKVYFKKKLQEAKKAGPFILKNEKSQNKNHG